MPGDYSRDRCQATRENWPSGRGSALTARGVGRGATCAHSGPIGLRKATGALEEIGGLATVFSFPLALRTAHQPSAELAPWDRVKVPEGWGELNCECGHAQVHCGDVGWGEGEAACSSNFILLSSAEG